MKPGQRSRRRLINIGLLTTGLAALVSGFLIQFCYHMGHQASSGASGASSAAGRTVWGWDHATWAVFHQIASALMLAFAAWHLLLNRKPLFATLRRGGAWRGRGPLLFTLFTLAVATSLSAWAVGAIFDYRFAERAFVEIHDKVVLPMSVLLVLHVWERRTRLLAPMPFG